MLKEMNGVENKRSPLVTITKPYTGRSVKDVYMFIHTNTYTDTHISKICLSFYKNDTTLRNSKIIYNYLWKGIRKFI